jgi:hypothetical protein
MLCQTMFSDSRFDIFIIDVKRFHTYHSVLKEIAASFKLILFASMNFKLELMRSMEFVAFMVVEK